MADKPVPGQQWLEWADGDDPPRQFMSGGERPVPRRIGLRDLTFFSGGRLWNFVIDVAPVNRPFER